MPPAPSFPPAIDGERLLARLEALGDIGRVDGRLIRLAASDADRAGRDQLVAWMEQDGLAVTVDQVGNIFGVWAPPGTAGQPCVLLGSHIDSVIDAGIYDGCYGVLGALEVVAALTRSGLQPARPIAVAAFTNEEGVRFAPDMLGSLVHVGGLSVADALATVATDGATLGDELTRIGYAGSLPPGSHKAAAYVELHIEQGPILERDSVTIGAVANLQGISWQRVTIEGVANHAGTTPMGLRRDAGAAAAEIAYRMRQRARSANGQTVVTVGTMAFEPNAINVIPARATFTVDLRNPDADQLADEEAALAALLETVAFDHGVAVSVERLARFDPVTFDAGIVALIETAAAARGRSCRRMTSGAGHDAQMLARVAPAAMIFVPSVGGISHNPAETTAPEHLVAGAEILLDVASALAAR